MDMCSPYFLTFFPVALPSWLVYSLRHALFHVGNIVRIMHCAHYLCVCFLCNHTSLTQTHTLLTQTHTLLTQTHTLLTQIHTHTLHKEIYTSEFTNHRITSLLPSLFTLLILQRHPLAFPFFIPPCVAQSISNHAGHALHSDHWVDTTGGGEH